MIDTITSLGPDPRAEPELLAALAAHEQRVLASAGRGDLAVVARAEADVQADPARAFTFAADGNATLRAAGRTWAAGRFEVASLATLRTRAAHASTAGSLRLFVLLGDRPGTDVGALQATAPAGTVFQLASQANCLEAPEPGVVPVASYVADPTQGPRAALSAFPGALLRHYRAPGADGRFAQRRGGRQLDLLAAVCAPGTAAVHDGYLRPADIADPAAFAQRLATDGDRLAVGVHDDVDVALGYDRDGAVGARRRVAQVLTTTLAAGRYGRLTPALEPIADALLRAAYVGTLLAARALGHRQVVLTLVGGGVFGNPIPGIWNTILAACTECERTAPGGLDVIVNGRELAHHVPPPELAAACRARGGVAVVLERSGVAVLR